MKWISLAFLLMATSALAANGFIFEPWEYPELTDVEDRIRRIKATGAGHVTFIVRICQEGATNSNISTCGNFEKELIIKTAWAKIARKHGLEFDLTPFPYIQERSGMKWRGHIDPEDPNRWFRQYREVILKIAKNAESLGASFQVVGNEMYKLNKHSGKWEALAHDVGSVFSKPLVMNVSWFELFQDYWKAYDIIGISAYFPIALSRFASQSTMESFWTVARTLVDRVSDHYGRPYQFTEVGYPSADGAAVFPSSYSYKNRKVDHEEQRRAYAAFVNVWKNDPNLVRTNFWVTKSPAPSEDLSRDKTYEIFNKPAQVEAEKFFAQ